MRRGRGGDRRLPPRPAGRVRPSLCRRVVAGRRCRAAMARQRNRRWTRRRGTCSCSPGWAPPTTPSLPCGTPQETKVEDRLIDAAHGVHGSLTDVLQAIPVWLIPVAYASDDRLASAAQAADPAATEGKFQRGEGCCPAPRRLVGCNAHAGIHGAFPPSSAAEAGRGRGSTARSRRPACRRQTSTGRGILIRRPSATRGSSRPGRDTPPAAARSGQQKPRR